ncbi:MAG: glutamate--cysteine ligase [Xanthomonadaceae bacterium]|nr:glutamate--cysteine ligase [Xanthomonadaceae bacterium]
MGIEHLQAVPHLNTALSGPLLQLEGLMLANQTRIEAWFRQLWRDTPAPFYASVDLRNAGYKLAPVDTNLFPAGFNNLGPGTEALCIQALQAVLERSCPTANGVLLIPEAHTRNLFYLDSVARLVELLRMAGYEVRLGTLAPDATGPHTLVSKSGHELTFEPVQRENDRLSVGDFRPCVVVLNNDLSSGRPAILDGVKQPILPPPGVGWSNRLKSEHFTLYSDVAREFAELLGIDPWLVDPLHRNCGQINFMKREGEECLAGNIDALLTQIRAKYSAYGIEQEPFVVVKADAGTYGMAVMMVRSSDEVRQLNRKQRTKMAAGKEGLEVSGAIIQEGVYTLETWGEKQSTAEPVVYMIDHFVVGGFYRVHTGKGTSDNLNAPGMQFEPLAFAEPCNTPDLARAPGACANRFYGYGVVARLALAAAAREIARFGSR